MLIEQQQVLERSLVPLEPWFSLAPEALLQQSDSLELNFHWTRSSDDPRELSEIPELRIWSLRADALCPWLPVLPLVATTTSRVWPSARAAVAMLPATTS